MLGKKSTLHFPKLAIFKQEFKNAVNNDNVYELKWNHFKINNEDNIPIIPEPIQLWLDNMKFSINSNYMKEIVKHTKLADDLWNNHLTSADTYIRDFCLNPVFSHIDVAFMLIADTVYDIKTGYYIRDIDKVFLKKIMIFKFWYEQCGYNVAKKQIDTICININTECMNEYYNMFIKNIQKLEPKCYPDLNN